MQLSTIGLALLKDLEGTRALPYRDTAGLLTTGTGHLLTKSERASGKIVIAGVPVRYAQGLTAAQIDALLRQDLAPVETILNNTGLSFTIGQFDSLCCLIFNIGIGAFLASTLLKRLTAGADAATIRTQWRRWVHAGGRVSLGLHRRRERELARWEAEEA